MTEVLENELQCIICSELFIKARRQAWFYYLTGGESYGPAENPSVGSVSLQAVILNCAHSFCSYCIEQWRKKKDECPICRQAILSQTRCLALDNCISSMVENLSLDMKARRQTLIAERKGERCVKSNLFF